MAVESFIMTPERPLALSIDQLVGSISRLKAERARLEGAPPGELARIPTTLSYSDAGILGAAVFGGDVHTRDTAHRRHAHGSEPPIASRLRKVVDALHGTANGAQAAREALDTAASRLSGASDRGEHRDFVASEKTRREWQEHSDRLIEQAYT